MLSRWALSAKGWGGHIGPCTVVTIAAAKPSCAIVCCLTRCYFSKMQKYRSRHIIHSVCLCHSVCLSVCLSVRTHSYRISWSIFAKSGIEVTTFKSNNEFIGGPTSHHAFPYFAPNNCHFVPKGPENPRKHKFANFCLECSESPKFPPLMGGKSDSRNTMVTQLWGKHYVPQNVFLVLSELTFTFAICCRPSVCLSVCRLSVTLGGIRTTCIHSDIGR